MKLTHNGKIGRLPEAIREQVNVRLRKGEKGRALAAWLNGLPEVRAMVVAEFSGKPVREQNLSEWRKGGHQQWLRAQEAETLMERLCTGGKLTEAGTDAIFENMGTFVAARYVVAMKRRLDQSSDPATAWKRIRECSRDVMALQRGEQQGRRLDLQQKRLEFQRQKARARLLMQLSGGRTCGENLGGEHSTLNIQHSTPKDQHLEENGVASVPIQNKNEEEKFDEPINCPSSSTENVKAAETGEMEKENARGNEFIRVNPGVSDHGNLKNISRVPQETIEAQEFKQACRVVGRNYPIGTRRCRRGAAATGVEIITRSPSPGPLPPGEGMRMAAAKHLEADGHKSEKSFHRAVGARSALVPGFWIEGELNLRHDGCSNFRQLESF